MTELKYTLEAWYIRWRGWVWNLLQLIAIGLILIGGFRLFAPRLMLSSLRGIVVEVSRILAIFPQISPIIYIGAGLIGTLAISAARTS